jgi:hypothetical protein
MTTALSFIREELQRVIVQRGPECNGTVALRSALQLVEVLEEHPSPAVRAEALKVALYALAHARSGE